MFASGDSMWIKLAIANLLSNAEKVTPQKDPIRIELREESDRVIVLVLDHGQVLAPETYETLWQIYSKGVPPGVEVSGFGIGLSLCKELIEAMGGRVWAGPRIGGGGAFAISLHRAVESPASDLTTEEEEEEEAVPQEKVIRPVKE